MATIGKIPVFTLIMYFIVFVVIHTIIGYNLKKYKKQKEEKPGNGEIEKVYKYLNITFKWFPAVYTIFVLFALLS